MLVRLAYSWLALASWLVCVMKVSLGFCVMKGSLDFLIMRASLVLRIMEASLGFLISNPVSASASPFLHIQPTAPHEPKWANVRNNLNYYE